MRLSQIHVKVSQGQEAAEKPINAYTASIALDGPGGVCVSLSSDKQFARRIMDGMTCIMAGDANLGYGVTRMTLKTYSVAFSISCGASSRCFEIKVSLMHLTFGTPPQGSYAFELQTTNGQARCFSQPQRSIFLSLKKSGMRFSTSKPVSKERLQNSQRAQGLSSTVTLDPVVWLGNACKIKWVCNGLKKLTTA